MQSTHSDSGKPIIRYFLDQHIPLSLSMGVLFHLLSFLMFSYAARIPDHFECPKCDKVVKPSYVRKKQTIITGKLRSSCTAKLVKGADIPIDHIKFPGYQGRHQFLVGAGSGKDGTTLVIYLYSVSI